MAEPFGARGLLKQYADGVEAASAISARGGSAWCEDGGQSTTRLGGDQSRRAAAPQPSPECSHVSGRPWARWVADSVKRCWRGSRHGISGTSRIVAVFRSQAGRRIASAVYAPV